MDDRNMTTKERAARLHATLERIETAVRTEQQRQLAAWERFNVREKFTPSAANLAAYIALRHHELREVQHELATLGLSSLGRLESRVLPVLQATKAALAALAGMEPEAMPGEAAFYAGEQLLAERRARIFGAPGERRHCALLVTCPAEAADDPSFMLGLARRQVEAVRINCAHDDAAAWARMVAHARAAEAETGHRLRIFMDLAGAKVRTGEIERLGKEKRRLFKGDRLAIVAPGELDRALHKGLAFAVECTLPEAVIAAEKGHTVHIDDGKIACIIVEKQDGALICEVTRAGVEGAKLKSEKGLNFPDSDLGVEALTAKDRADLAFVAQHADAIEYSFVSRPQDIATLQEELARHRPADWESIALVLKIETDEAIANLPELIVSAGARQPVAVMIARGDLAIEIGFTRLAEMQEEMLWISEAACIPAIWATQVLENLVKDGKPSRGEMTDAAMAARADCVMLNKGPYVLEAIDTLDEIIGRMGGHVQKKSALLRPLRSW